MPGRSGQSDKRQRRKNYRQRVRQFQNRQARIEQQDTADAIEEILESVLPPDHPGLKRNREEAG